MIELLQIVGAFILADAMSGIYHLVTDLGWNIPSQVSYFRKHHDHPETMTFDLQPMLGSIPCLIAAYFIWPWFFISLAIFVGFAQIPHYYIHHPENTPTIIKWLQKFRIVVTPDSHNYHHYGNGLFDTNFCIFTGWNDWWINPIGKWSQRFKRI
jgi:hypothetical protein